MSDKVFTMRIDENLLELLRRSAEKNKRSIAKEIEYILEQWCSPPDDAGIPLSDEMQNAVVTLLRIMKKEGKTDIDI